MMLAAAAFLCAQPVAIDGDTLRCGEDRVRLMYIDAPELDQCRRGRECVVGDARASKASLAQLILTASVKCEGHGFDHYGRQLAICFTAGIDLGCEQVKRGHAVPRYGATKAWRGRCEKRK